MNSTEVLIPTGKATRWTKEEINILINLVTENIDVIKGKFSPTLTSNNKHKCWESNVESINATNIDKRSLPQVEKKWIDLQSEARKKEAKRRRDSTQTGGGPASLENGNNDLKIISVISDAAISGLQTGYDSLVKWLGSGTALSFEESVSAISVNLGVGWCLVHYVEGVKMFSIRSNVFTQYLSVHFQLLFTMIDVLPKFHIVTLLRHWSDRIRHISKEEKYLCNVQDRINEKDQELIQLYACSTDVSGGLLTPKQKLTNDCSDNLNKKKRRMSSKFIVQPLNGEISRPKKRDDTVNEDIEKYLKDSDIGDDALPLLHSLKLSWNLNKDPIPTAEDNLLQAAYIVLYTVPMAIEHFIDREMTQYGLELYSFADIDDDDLDKVLGDSCWLPKEQRPERANCVNSVDSNDSVDISSGSEVEVRSSDEVKEVKEHNQCSDEVKCARPKPGAKNT
ncbi:unnamed protein product [Mytilus coruscus]|uniref:Myb/SANT-like DNA-binding domain-containing protein n=1 Tax=Mytilus coruscus TaxID=42192 RepID=A0A6J8DJ89_MYTCO|nr:unnamed protein product [Mytilus coruscus]